MTVPFIQPSLPNPPPFFPSSLSPTPLDARQADQFKCNGCEWTAGSCYGTKSPFFCMRQRTTLDTSAVWPAAFQIQNLYCSACFFCCCYILIYLPLCNLDTEFSSSELTLSRIKSVLFLCFFVSTHKFFVVHDLRQMFLYQGRFLKHFLKDFFCRRLKIIITAWREDK